MKSLFIKGLLGLLLLASTGVLYAADSSLPKYPDPVGEKCVEPTDIMRREHMNMILHQRDETTRKGVRGDAAKYSLKDCIDCHAGYDEKNKPIPINAKGQFCESCHTYTAVSIDCFSCHRTTPSENNPRRPEMSVKSDIAPEIKQMEAIPAPAETVSSKGAENE